MSPIQLILCGIGLLCVGLTLRRIATRRPGKARRTGDDLATLTTAARRIIEPMEVRLYDYEREIDGRIGTRLAMLDRLILEADQHIAELEQLRQAWHDTTAQAESSSTADAEQLRLRVDEFMTRISDRKAA